MHSAEQHKLQVGLTLISVALIAQTCMSRLIDTERQPVINIDGYAVCVLWHNPNPLYVHIPADQSGTFHVGGSVWSKSYNELQYPA